MWESSNREEKKFNAETYRLIGEAQLHKFNFFLEKFGKTINTYKSQFKNYYNISSELILIDVNIVPSLGGICKEIQSLVNEAEWFYRQFLFYKNTGKLSDHHISVSKMIESLQKVHCYINRVQHVTVLTLRQLSATLGKRFYITSNTSSFLEIFNNLGDLFICILKLDSLLESQTLKEHWFSYRRLVKNMYHNHTKYDFEREQLSSLDKTLMVLENDLLMGGMLKTIMEKCLEDKILYSQVKSCSLNQELNAYLNHLLDTLEKDTEHVLFVHQWLKLNVLFVFYLNIFGTSDKKLIKRTLELDKKVSACTLIGNILWYPEQFLLKHIQNSEKYINEKTVDSYRLSILQYKSQTLPKESDILCAQGCHFLVDLKKITELNTRNLRTKHFQSIEHLLIDGLTLIQKISSVIKWTLNVHTEKGLPVTKSVVLAVCKLTEVLKSICIMFNKNLISMVYIILLICQHLSHKALSILHNIRKQFTQEKSYKEHQLDVLSSLNVCEQALRGPNTNETLLFVNLSLSASGLSASNLEEIRSILNKLELMINFTTLLKDISNCSFLYWHQNYILPVYFSKLITSKANLSRYQLILSVLTDCAATAGPEINEVTSKIIKDRFFVPVEQIIETNLRLQTHLHLQLPPSDPFQNYFALNFHKYLPTPMDNHYKSITKETEHYLSSMFYNLTTVVLHDWKTYGEMRRLAYNQYGLETVDDNLPMQTLEQGLDVLEIMRNINIFVSKYLYNLNNQVFIEESSNNKHLNSINISHVANSIRTHGIGIMNTTVNYTYQFLRNKFYIFSQFMFDEHIKSRLLKDLRYFAEHKNELHQMYPYERAEKFNSGIRQLGLNQNGESYLDLFRKLITHIGNAMGYIRLIKSGGRRCLADGTCFIPDLKSIQYLNEIISQEDMPDLTQKAGTCFLDDLQSFLDNIEEATEYFKLLVKVFVPVLRNNNNVHLKNFYMIAPPLTINFIEHSLNCKEKLNKRNKADCAFTDDGFALGLAYIIELLNQESQLNSLHWFQSVQRKFKNERLKIKEQSNILTNSDDTKLRQTLTLTEKRISLFEKEFQLLYYSFSSARLFFQV
ncbi:WASH complex subunit 4 isoform X2 [Anoplophora glabripennis]|uniref:WASH complex subunit 4 isoform X2 n=1 Tax=Anoplophora glabripennis TaxID=217634 RepID=UPI000874178B|nr:WASH complex subunit 4 isoform X2 [Anoplophora glabripennis]